MIRKGAYSLPLKDVKITDEFWSKRIRTTREISLEYMWNVLNDQVEGVPKSGCIENFRIAAGLCKGEFYGFEFQDSDLYKWLEAVGYSLETHPDAELEKRADRAIELVKKAQLDDGYIDTFYIITGIENRWTCVRSTHEMYVAGHMFEAACAYYNATGKDMLLKCACAFADHIDSVFGPEENKKHGYPGHQEIELGLAGLYRITGNEKYIKLAKYFLDERGQQPYYYDEEAKLRGEENDGLKNWFRTQGRGEPYNYQQAHKPVREQKEAVGHAVRCCYMLSSMAETANLTGDSSLLDAANDLYTDITQRQMYITGGVGSQGDGESFSFDYDLPNDRMYNETCASIALLMSTRRFFEASPNAVYTDIAEKTLYNGIISGVSLDGTRFFYCNPMEVWPERAKRRADMHIDAVRQGWYGCACCPPNLARTMTGLGNYIWSQDDRTLYLNQFISNEAVANMNGVKAGIVVDSDYLRSGNVAITFRNDIAMTIALRIPGWCEDVYSVRYQNKLYRKSENGYVYITADFHANDKIEIEFGMECTKMYCNDHVPFNAGRIALMRGPLVYCIEECDNGKQLWDLRVTGDMIRDVYEPETLGGVTALYVEGKRDTSKDNQLYSTRKSKKIPCMIKFIPYYAWCNREPGEMSVWVRGE